VSTFYIDNKVPVKLPIQKIEIILEWKDGFSEGGKHFEDVHQFSDFLIANPELAKAVGYIPKGIRDVKR
jgi:hypothetical protein